VDGGVGVLAMTWPEHEYRRYGRYIRPQRRVYVPEGPRESKRHHSQCWCQFCRAERSYVASEGTPE
jgi:hypothetical protein